ncbi:autotransporter-associated beta strand repeat-containing protein [Mesorhizobium sp. B4-1-3]|uniref:autotransporter-associated beta strand repeat-containing protein n=1 Tax=Mesorhizobium sp. B4-1-3 TaxID=2589889 RepID=UPI0015E35689|nr:autotransporter-associated beta strand repeat-containing protein [Mesorhizobium sp. B4-1-3]
MSRIQDSSAETRKRRKDLSATASRAPAYGARLMRGGRMTKWKGHVASRAPHLAQIVTATSKAWAVTLVPAALVLAVATGQAGAASRYWDPNGTTAGRGGSGTWDTTSNFWSPNGDGLSGPYTTWNNGALDDAFFGGTAGIINLAAPITVHSLTFDDLNSPDGVYTFTGGVLTLGGVTPTITVNGNANDSATFGNVIAGASGLTKAGGGVLVLNGANTFSGGITLSGGTLTFNGDAALGAGSNNISVTGNSTLTNSGTTSLASGRTVTIGSGSTLTIAKTGAGDLGSAFYTGAGALNVANAGGTTITLNNDNNDYTGQTSFNSSGSTVNFTSIRNVGGGPSALGAPTTAANGTIIAGIYLGNLVYTGTGDTSDRNWTLNGAYYSGQTITNGGTGTLTLSGNFTENYLTPGYPGVPTYTFTAQSADMVLSGVISSTVAVDHRTTFNGGGAGRTITLGGANTYTSNTTIGNVTVRASTLADIGTSSSIGMATNLGSATTAVSITNNGTLSYVGGGASTNRTMSLDGAAAISNDGTGALNLTGGLSFLAGGASPDVLTLGGTYAGVNTLSGTLSGVGNLVMNGGASDVWLLTAANTFTGPNSTTPQSITVQGGTLRAGNAQAFGLGVPAAIVNGGTLDLGGFDTTFVSLAGTGGSVAMGGNNLTINGTTSASYGGNIAGSGGLIKGGTGTLTLAGANTYTGATTVQGGTLVLNFAAGGAPASNIISNLSTLDMSGGSLTVTGGSVANAQSFAQTNITAGSNTISATSGSGGLTLNLGNINHTGGLVNFVLPASGNIKTTSAALGGWATVSSGATTDYAQVVGGNITALTSYATKDDASTWVDGDIVSDTGGAANTQYFGTVSDAVDNQVQLGGLKYTVAKASTVTIAGGNTLGVDGTIIVGSSVGNNTQTITGGQLTGPIGGGTLGILQNNTGTFVIQSTVVDNSGPIGVTVAGTGTVNLTANNTYTGATTVSGGTLWVGTIGNGGTASAVGASSNASSNLVLENGRLLYTGGTSATDRGFTLVNGGSSRTIDVANAAANLTFTGLVTSPDDAGLTKAGAGTLTLANAANDYVGPTSITGGILSVGTLANGGVASGIGRSSSASSNLLLSGGGTLQYTGATTSTDRAFTLGAGGGGFDVANAGTRLTVSGTGVGPAGTGALIKNGAGTLILSGTNTYVGGTVVNAGTLQAGSTQAFGGAAAGVGVGGMTVNSGATLALAGFDNTVGGLNGNGTVALGSATLKTNNNGTFSGSITGSGGFTSAGNTQIMTGCNNTYSGATTLAGGNITTDCIQNGGAASGIGASASASSNLIFNSGNLAYTGGTVTTDRGFTLTGNGGINVTDAATTLTFTGTVVGPAGLIKNGAGTLVLSGTNTYSGGTTVNAGILRAGSAQAFGGSGGMNVVGGATLDLNGFDNTVYSLDGAGNVSMGAGTLTIMGYYGGTFTGAISGTGGITRTGGGYAQVLSGCNNSYTGVTTVNGGGAGLSVDCLANGNSNSSIGAASAGAANLVLDNGVLTYTGAGGATGTTDRLFTLGTGGGTLGASGTGPVSFTNTGAIALAGTNTARTLTLQGTNTGNNTLSALLADNGTGKTSLTKSGAGTWILNNPTSTYTGVTTISGGVLGVSKLSNGLQASSLGASSSAASNLVIGNGATLRYTGAGDNTDRLFTLAAGSTSIESSGTGVINFTNTAAVTYSGSGPRTIGLGGTNTGLNTMGGQITDGPGGATTLGKSGPGTWVLTGNNTFTGNTVINDGNLMIGNGGTSGNAGAGNVIIASATSTLSFNRSDTFNFTGTITPDSGAGKGTIAQIGTGTTVLTAAGNNVAATSVDAGTLQVNGGLTTATVAMNGAGTLTVNGTVGAAAGGTSTFTGDAGASTINIATTGTLRANGDLGGGNDTVNVSGTLATGAAALNLGAGNDTLVLNDTAVFTGAGVDAGTGGETGAGDTLQVNTTAGRTLDGANVSNFETLDKQGAGTLILTGNHNYSAGTTIETGTLQVGTGAVAGALTTPSVTDNGTLAFNLNNNYTFGGAISGTGAVNKLGTGVTTLTGTNTYTGATNVSAGTLIVDGNQSGATGTTTVASGATLGGTGTIGGSVTVADGGTLAPGEAGNAPGALTIDGGLTLNNTSAVNFNFGQANVPGGPLNDLVNVGGNLTLDGTLNVTQTTGGAFGPGVYRIFNYGGSLTNNGLDVTDPNYSVQTSVANQVNLVNSAGLQLSYWDGDAGPHSNSIVNGGNGTWQVAGASNNWTDITGTFAAPFANASFAIFEGAAGTVTVDNTNG